ncbi:MAG: NUDIX domain-containing protein [Gemmataceae bacterium]
MKRAAGTLLYRQGAEGWEVLLVHPSGNYNRKAPWSIPKGEPESHEMDLELVARRETIEETGVTPEQLIPLGETKYAKSRKIVHCFAGPAPQGAAPQPTSWEVDKAEFVPFEQAKEILHPDQCVFLDRLLDHLGGA